MVVFLGLRDMYRRILVLTSAAVALAGRSPNYDLVEEFQNSPAGSRFSSDIYEDAKLDLESLVRKYQYTLEKHQVVTSDGYLLTAHRIPRGRDRNSQPGPRPAVLLMHGLFSSSADYVILGPGSALGYYLAEEGYDVWMLNARGNGFSRNHTTLNPDRRGDSEFWQFSWDEIGRYDLPAYIDYVIETTGQPKVHYIGHSQGGTSFLVMASTWPEYNDKIISFQALAPAAYLVNSEQIFFLLLSPYERIFESIANSLGVTELLPQSEVISFITYNYCRDGALPQPLCLLLFVNDQNADMFNSTMLPAFLGHAPAGASVRQVLHYAQNIKYGTFSRYHYGFRQNLEVYGRTTPPPYDMSRVTARSYLHYGLNDIEVNYRDILLLEEKLPNGRAIQVPRSSFTHYDFIWGVDCMEQLYVKVLELMRQTESLIGFK